MTTKRIKVRQGTAAQWTTANPVLSAGEIGVEVDTRLLKVGNGVTAWASLAYSAATAENVSVTDSAGYFTAGNVETVLAEVHTAKLAVARYNAQRYMPTAAIAQTCARSDATSNALTGLSTGRLSFCLIYLPAGTINSITVMSGGTAMVTPSNQWFALYSTARAKLAVTNDDTTTAWSTNTTKTLSISGGYTVAVEGLYYLGVMVAASTVPTLAGFVSGNGNAAIATLPPIVAGHDATNTGLTTPATAPTTAAALTANAQASFYAYVS